MSGGMFSPWICPKCGRVYSGAVMQCAPCNNQVGRSPFNVPMVPPQIKRAS